MLRSEPCERLEAWIIGLDQRVLVLDPELLIFCAKLVDLTVLGEHARLMAAFGSAINKPSMVVTDFG